MFRTLTKAMDPAVIVINNSDDCIYKDLLNYGHIFKFPKRQALVFDSMHQTYGLNNLVEASFAPDTSTFFEFYDCDTIVKGRIRIEFRYGVDALRRREYDSVVRHYNYVRYHRKTSKWNYYHGIPTHPRTVGCKTGQITSVLLPGSKTTVVLGGSVEVRQRFVI